MADPTGFLRYPRAEPARRPVAVRIQDWREVYEPFPRTMLGEQASRCMDCGIPFCHGACPLGNLIPEWNDLVRRGLWEQAAERLHATNNFPEFTGRLCPAPCESACVLGISAEPVTIKQVERDIADEAIVRGWVRPLPADTPSNRSVAVVGSGPAGLAAAQQLARAGHAVTVFERADRPGGLLRYGIPEFKLGKALLDDRLVQLAGEGVRFVTGCDVGKDLPAGQLRATHDAVVLAIGATTARDLDVPGRELAGVHLAMEYLPLANRVAAGDLAASPIDAAGRRVVIIGGGDTGADCLGTAHRQGALEVHQLEILPIPPPQRDPSTPWPTWPLLLRSSAAHEEGGHRRFAVRTDAFLAGSHGRLRGLRLVDAATGAVEELPAELALLALGFTGVESGPLLSDLGLRPDPRGRVPRDRGYATPATGIFCAGDAGRGQSLVVWAIAEGRAAAAAVDSFLRGAPSGLPAPIPADAVALQA